VRPRKKEGKERLGRAHGTTLAFRERGCFPGRGGRKGKGALSQECGLISADFKGGEGEKEAAIFTVGGGRWRNRRWETEEKGGGKFFHQS